MDYLPRARNTAGKTTHGGVDEAVVKIRVDNGRESARVGSRLQLVAEKLDIDIRNISARDELIVLQKNVSILFIAIAVETGKRT